MSDVANLRYAQFQIAPKIGSATRPINVRYSRQYLQKRGYVNSGTGKLTVPVFGLYAGRNNSVTITVGFKDGTSQQTDLTIQTAAYDGHVLQSQRRPGTLAGTTSSYDFIMLKSYADPTTPIIIDTDAEIRWVGTAGVSSQPSVLFDNAFYLTSGTSLLRTEFDGKTTNPAPTIARSA